MDHEKSAQTHLDACPRCDAQAVRVVRRKESHVTADGLEVAFTDQISVCEACGVEFYTHEQSLSAARAIAAAVRRERSLPDPAQITKIRERYVLSQADFEKALGVGPKTSIRWEKGTVPPSGAAVSLLWIADQFPYVFGRLAEKNGVIVTNTTAPVTSTNREAFWRGGEGRVVTLPETSPKYEFASMELSFSIPIGVEP